MVKLDTIVAGFLAELCVAPFVVTAHSPIPLMPYNCADPLVVCDAYSSPGHTPWDTTEGWIDCLQGCIDEWVGCGGWTPDDIEACLACCNDHYYIPTPIPVAPDPPVWEEWAGL